MTVAFALAALTLRFWPGAEAALGYERAQIAAAQYWRLWTAHLVHFSWSHLFWNLLVFVPAGLWAERLLPDRLRLLLLLGPALIGVALYGLDPGLARYAGLSGVVAGVVAFLALVQLRRGTSDRWFWRSVLLLLVAKIGLEFALSEPLFARFAETGVRAVPLAHAAGVLGAGLILFGRRRRR
ncbi:Rhomboid family protein [Opitutus terrae PB90-1]|uniref:Rhomboid family protein n=2 Tax=Opitutus terrae TaxID=107709 RepID=B1ZVJ1_OPITP|nr:Rhomboid family protein [Opitutus terrae PB90-1]